MPLPADYGQRVYAGVLGKMIGVYLGRPIEGWRYRDIVRTFGQIDYYVHRQRNVDLIVADDDLSGTFTFIRALEDHPDAGHALTAEQIGQTWLNYIIENKTILWWGGLGNSTEHTAFLRLQAGIPAPRSGSMQLNGHLVAEQIGAQIFIDGWAMVAPGDPDLAAALAERAARVSHDGEAVFAARALAAMEAQAFVEPDLNKLFDLAMRYLPRDSVVYPLIDELRDFREKTDDWHKAMADLVEPRYGYDQYGGGCHIIPNHALVALALLWGEGDFQKSLRIVNTLGWDTDCNSGNVGCLLGIKNGLAGIDAGPDWRGPVADRLYLPTADAGESITDAVRVSLRLENIGRRLAGLAPRRPKEGARFHFSLPGSVQGFVCDEAPDSAGTLNIDNVDGRLRLSCRGLAPGRVARALTATFIPPGPADSFYRLISVPALYPTQQVEATVEADPANHQPVDVRLFIRHCNAADALTHLPGPITTLEPGARRDLSWIVPETGGQPIAQIGFEITGRPRASGKVFVDRLHWHGTPSLTLARPREGGSAWMRAWAEGVSHAGVSGDGFRLVQNAGRGLFMHGTRDWTDYTVTASITPILASAAGLAVRVQGMRRYYALLLALSSGTPVLRLIKMRDDEIILAETPADWALDGRPRTLSLAVAGIRLIGTLANGPTLTATDNTHPLTEGGIAFVIENGRIHTGPVEVRSAVPSPAGA